MGSCVKMKVSILEPRGEVWHGQAKEVILPVSDGEAAILDFHQAFLMRLKNGYVRLLGRRTFVKDGIAFMRSNELTVFIES